MAQRRAFTESFDLYPEGASTAGFGMLSTWINAGTAHENGFVPGRFGGRAVRGSGFGAQWRPIPSTTQVVYGVAFRFSAAGNHESQQPVVFLSSNGNEQLRLFVTIAGILQVRRGATVLAATSEPVITAMAWAYIEIAANIHDTAGSVRVWLNDFEVPELSLDNVDTRNSVDADVGRVQFAVTSVDGWADDMYCEIDGLERVGEGRIYGRPATADDLVQFLPSTGTDNYAMIDEAPANSSDYNSSDVLGARDVFRVADMEYNPDVIYGIQLVTLAQKDDAGARALTPFIISGAEELPGDEFVLTLNSFIFTRDWIPLDPNTDAPWTKAAIDAIKTGYEVTV